MNWEPLVGFLALVYAGLVIYIGGTKKPEAIWEMGKIKMFRKVLGEKGTQIFFFIWAALAAGLGIWLFTL